MRLARRIPNQATAKRTRERCCLSPQTRAKDSPVKVKQLRRYSMFVQPVCIRPIGSATSPPSRRTSNNVHPRTS
jgi:hypothetical protein